MNGGSIALAPALPERVDVVIVGARAAGAATAMLAARGGLDVLAVDRGGYGTDTLSTHALMRGAVVQLARWGLLDRLERAGTPLVRRTTFAYGALEIPVEIRPRGGIQGLCAPRRTRLDALLVDAAREAGATVTHGLRCAGLVRGPGGRVRGVELVDGAGRARRVLADRVVGADGLRSGIARESGAAIRRRGAHASGVVYGYWRGLGIEGYEWRYAPGASTGAIPTDDGATCVFVSFARERFRDELAPDVAAGFARIVAEVSPGLAAALGRAERRGGFRGFPGVPGCLRAAHGPGWALVGDAGFFRDPITAHGITDALRDAELLARALATGRERSLVDYEQERDALAVELLDLSDAVAAYDWSPERVQELHRQLSEVMKREVRGLEAMARAAEPDAAVAALASGAGPLQEKTK